MGPVLLVFVAEQFDTVGVRLKEQGELDRERPGVHLGIVDGGFHVQVSEIAPPEPLRHAQRFAVRLFLLNALNSVPAFEKAGQRDKAKELYRKAYDLATAHNPPAAFARRSPTA